MTEQGKNLVAYCGLYCGDCINHKGEIADLARDLRKKLREVKFDQFAEGISKYFKEFQNYSQCYEVLGAMVRLRCSRTCETNGGPPGCAIRNCCRKKGLEGCWKCGEFEDCKKFAFLESIHGEANLNNLRRLRNNGVEAFIKGEKGLVKKETASTSWRVSRLRCRFLRRVLTHSIFVQSSPQLEWQRDSLPSAKPDS